MENSYKNQYMKNILILKIKKKVNNLYYKK